MKRLVRVVVLSSALCAVAGLPAMMTVPAQAQQGKQRVVRGLVLDKSGAPVAGATVFLKDTHTMAVQSFLSASDGSYRIGQISPSSDYDLWVETNGKRSNSHSISSFDSKNEITVNFKVDR